MKGVTCWYGRLAPMDEPEEGEVLILKSRMHVEAPWKIRAVVQSKAEAAEFLGKHDSIVNGDVLFGVVELGV